MKNYQITVENENGIFEQYFFIHNGEKYNVIQMVNVGGSFEISQPDYDTLPPIFFEMLVETFQGNANVKMYPFNSMK